MSGVLQCVPSALGAVCELTSSGCVHSAAVSQLDVDSAVVQVFWGTAAGFIPPQTNAKGWCGGIPGSL